MSYHERPKKNSIEQSILPANLATEEDLHAAIRDYYELAEKVFFDEEQKFLVFKILRTPEQNFIYEPRFASILSDMKKRNLITDWYPVPAYAPLDVLKVDFLVIYSKGILPVQVTSDQLMAKQRKKKIRAMYQLSAEDVLPIGVVALLTRNRYEKSEDEIIKIIKELRRTIPLVYWSG